MSSVTPEHGALILNTQKGRDIVVTFDQAIGPSASATSWNSTQLAALVSLRAGSIRGDAIAATITINAARDRITINPDADLPWATSGSKLTLAFGTVRGHEQGADATASSQLQRQWTRLLRQSSGAARARMRRREIVLSTSS